MNEVLFVFHALFVSSISFFCLRFGEKGLVSWYVLCVFLSNLLINKQIDLFGYTITCVDAYTIGGYLSLQLLQEFFSKRHAEQAINFGFVILLFLGGLILTHLLYEPSVLDPSGAFWNILFGSSFRIVLCSLILSYGMQKLSLPAYRLVRALAPTISFSMAACVVQILIQFIDTGLFTFIALYDLVAAPFDVFVISYGVKLVCIFLSSSVTHLVLTRFSYYVRNHTHIEKV